MQETNIELQEHDGALEVIAQPDPAALVAHYTKVANALSDVVEQRGLFTKIGQKKHLSAEAWQTILSLDGANPIIEYCHLISEPSEEPRVWEAKARIEKHGEIIGTGIMVCGSDDYSCQGRTGTSQARAGMSSAETWAIAKAARGKYAWVVTLAGYSPTPEDEMNENAQSGAANQKSKPATRRRPVGDTITVAAAAKVMDEAESLGAGRKWVMETINDKWGLKQPGEMNAAQLEEINGMLHGEPPVEGQGLLDAEGKPVEGE